MCGIAGFISDCDNAYERIYRMADSMKFRGPDGQGIWIDDTSRVALAQTRLSIIDLSTAGHQPMSYMKGRFWITFNGEIYNYKEIRNLLEQKGFIFTSDSDTEVILAGWACWEIKLLPRLRGMFAFGIWDCKEQKLALCRDRIGIKPLLWSETTSGLVFASTLKSILDSGFVEPVIENQGIFDIFSTGSVCQPRTIIRNVKSLSPGTCMIFKHGQTMKTLRYWHLPEEVELMKPEMSRLSYIEATRHVRSLLEEACRYHLVSDVPVGSFLSGGIDSTAITAIMSQQSTNVVKSFSIGFEKNSYLQDELKPAKSSATFIGTDHTEIQVTGRIVEDAFDDLIRTIDQPSFDGANTFFISRIVGAELKVALSGIGGDELFAGYEHFKHFQDVAGESAKWFDPILSRIHYLRPNRVTFSAELRLMTLIERYAQLRRGMTDIELNRNFSNSILNNFSPNFLQNYLEQYLWETHDSIFQTSILESQHYLVNTLLRDTDAMSMGHGLEVRPVFLDHILIENVLALPSKYKLKENRFKAVLKDAVSDLLPPDLLNRPKTGFTLPVGLWLRNELRPRLINALNGNTAKMLFKPSFLEECKKNVNSRNYTRTIWTLLVFVSWIDDGNIHID